MDAARAHQLLKGHITAVQKVYTAVPISEPWTQHQIAGEMSRTGIRLSSRALEGFLRTLMDSGLIRETDRNTFIRTPITTKEKVVNQSKSSAVADPAPVIIPPPPSTALERLTQLISDLDVLTGKIGLTVIEVEDQLKQCSKDTEKLKQLQALLKGL